MKERRIRPRGEKEGEEDEASEGGRGMEVKERRVKREGKDTFRRKRRRGSV